MKVKINRPIDPPIESVTLTLTPDEYKALLEVATRHKTVANAIYSNEDNIERINMFLLDTWNASSEYRRLVNL